jgi:predicted PurR-regulated permease PerM
MKTEVAKVIGDSAAQLAAQGTLSHALIRDRWRDLVIVAASALVGALLLVRLLPALAHPLLLLFAAIVLAEALAPAVNWLEQRLPRPLAVVLVYVALALVLGVVGWLLVPRFVAQAQEFLAAAPALVGRARSLLAGWDPTTSDQILAALQHPLTDFGVSLVSLPMKLLSALVEIGLVVLLSAYWLLSAPRLHRFGQSLVPARRRAAVRAVLAEIRETVGGFVRGKGLSMMIVGAVAYIGLLVIGVEFPLVLAVIAGLSELIPIVGVYLATIPAVAIALLASPTQALLVLAFYVALQQVESNVLLPALMRQQAGIPWLVAIVALVVGERLAGILGALVAIPIAGALQVLVIRVAAPGIRRWSGAALEGDEDEG